MSQQPNSQSPLPPQYVPTAVPDHDGDPGSPALGTYSAERTYIVFTGVDGKLYRSTVAAYHARDYGSATEVTAP